jgi:hypothetical protein
MGSEAMDRALVTEACRSDAKVLDPVVLVCGADRLAARELTELVLLILCHPWRLLQPNTKLGRYSLTIGPVHLEH